MQETQKGVKSTTTLPKWLYKRHMDANWIIVDYDSQLATREPPHNGAELNLGILAQEVPVACAPCRDATRFLTQARCDPGVDIIHALTDCDQRRRSGGH